MRLVRTLPAKAGAALLGGALALGGLGAPSALTGTMQLASDDKVVNVDDDVLTEDEGGGAGGTDDQDGSAGTTGDQDGGGAGKDTVDRSDPATAPVPTSVSEAARTHAFDEACGNHGAYVSWFAQNDEEPQCATDARAGTVPPEGDRGKGKPSKDEADGDDASADDDTDEARDKEKKSGREKGDEAREKAEQRRSNKGRAGKRR